MVGQSILYIIVLESKKSADIHCTEYLEVNSIWRYVRFFADHRVIFVVRVVRVPSFTFVPSEMEPQDCDVVTEMHF